VPRRNGPHDRRGGSEELRAGIRHSAGEAAGTDTVEQVEVLVGDLQHPGTSMPHELAWQVKQAPAHGGDLMALPTLAESGMLEKDEEIVRDDANAEEGGIGGKLPAGHARHAKANLQFLDAVLGYLAALPIPDQGVGSRFDPVAGNHMVLWRIVEQFNLAWVLHNDQPERLPGVVHAVHGFGDGAVGIPLPGGFGNLGNGLQGRGIQPSADGEGLAVSSQSLNTSAW